MSSTLKEDESDEPFHVQQRKQIGSFRDEWARHDHGFTPRVSVSRSIFPIRNDRDRRYFLGGETSDQIGNIDNMRAIFGRTYADEPEALIEQLRTDEAIAAADTLMLTIPSQLGVDYNAHILEGIVQDIAPALGWR